MSIVFDRENPADLAALKAEIQTDPLLLGYSSATTTQGILDIINDQTPAYPVTIPTEDLDIPDVAAVIDPGEFSALGEYDKQWVIMFINQPAEVPLKPLQAKFLSLFGPGSNTRTAVLALRDTTGSRAEVLFGKGTIITRSDYIAARDS